MVERNRQLTQTDTDTQSGVRRIDSRIPGDQSRRSTSRATYIRRRIGAATAVVIGSAAVTFVGIEIKKAVTNSGDCVPAGTFTQGKQGKGPSLWSAVEEASQGGNISEAMDCTTNANPGVDFGDLQERQRVNLSRGK